MKNKPYDYLKVKKSLIESGQLKQDKDMSNELNPDLDDTVMSIPQEEGYNYEISSKKAGVVKKRKDYFNRTDLEKLLRIYPEEEIYDYKLAKKQLGIN